MSGICWVAVVARCVLAAVGTGPRFWHGAIEVAVSVVFEYGVRRMWPPCNCHRVFGRERLRERRDRKAPRHAETFRLPPGGAMETGAAGPVSGSGSCAVPLIDPRKTLWFSEDLNPGDITSTRPYPWRCSQRLGERLHQFRKDLEPGPGRATLVSGRSCKGVV